MGKYCMSAEVHIFVMRLKRGTTSELDSTFINEVAPFCLCSTHRQ